MPRKFCDLPLARCWSRVQLLSSDPADTVRMTSATRYAALLSIAVIACSLASPRVTGAQLSSARPASVALTVVVPPRSTSTLAAASETSVSLISTTPTTIDFETTVDAMDRPATRLEVRLRGAWNAESTVVSVRNSRGEFERLSGETRVVAIDPMPGGVGSTTALRFRVESARPRRGAPLAIPLEYRITVGRGDEFSVWSFSSLLQVDTER